MRPLDKKNAGDSIDLYADIFDMGTTVHTIKSEYKEYGKARKVLLANFGNYCSYCENYLPMVLRFRLSMYSLRDWRNMLI